MTNSYTARPARQQSKILEAFASSAHRRVWMRFGTDSGTGPVAALQAAARFMPGSQAVGLG